MKESTFVLELFRSFFISFRLVIGINDNFLVNDFDRKHSLFADG